MIRLLSKNKNRISQNRIRALSNTGLKHDPNLNPNPQVPQESSKEQPFENYFKSPSTAATLNVPTNKSSFSSFFAKKAATSEVVGNFDRPEFLNTGSLLDSIEKCKNDSYNLVEKICTVDPGSKTINAIDELSNCLCNLADPSSFLLLNHPSADFRKAAEEASIEIGKLVEELNNESSLYEALENAIHNPTEKMDPTTELLGNLFLRDFQQCGEGIKDAETKQRAIELSAEHLELNYWFQENCDKPGKLILSEMPEHIQENFKGIVNRTIDINSPWSTQSLEVEREAVYRAYYSENLNNGQQMEILKMLLATRYDLARVYGYDSWAARGTEFSLAENPEFVVKFLETVTSKIAGNVAKEHADLLEIKKNDKNAFRPDVIFEGGRKSDEILRDCGPIKFCQIGPNLSPSTLGTSSRITTNLEIRTATRFQIT